MTVRTKFRHTLKPLANLQLNVGKKVSKTSPTGSTNYSHLHPPLHLKSRLFRLRSRHYRISKQSPLLFDPMYNGWSKENNPTNTFISASTTTAPTHTSLNSTHWMIL